MIEGKRKKIDAKHEKALYWAKGMFIKMRILPIRERCH